MEPGSASSSPDVQASAPAVPVWLSRVGVSRVEKVIRIGGPGARRSQLYSARLDCFVDLSPEQKGAHVALRGGRERRHRGGILGEVALRAEELAQHIAERVRQRQDALRAEVTIDARYPEHKPAPSRASPPRRCTPSTLRPSLLSTAPAESSASPPKA